MGRYRQAGYQAEAVSRDKWGWEPPVIDENFEPERITLSLSIGTGNQKATIEYLTDHITAKTSELTQLLGVKKYKDK